MSNASEVLVEDLVGSNILLFKYGIYLGLFICVLMLIIIITEIKMSTNSIKNSIASQTQQLKDHIDSKFQQTSKPQ
jgi:hypothetical protein